MVTMQSQARPFRSGLAGNSPSRAVQGREDMVHIEFLVSVPPDTPEDSRIFIAGNNEELGEWRADGLPLLRLSHREFWAQADLPRGRVTEYKITRGSWDSVELSPSGTDAGNRLIQPDSGQLVLVSVDRWAASATAPSQADVACRIQIHQRFYSRFLRNGRTIRVCMPPGYDAEPARRYPVLYLQDGQNLFDSRSAMDGVAWQADRTAARLVRGNQVEPIILVGIDSTRHRLDEYGPSRDPGLGAGGRSDDYVQFIAQELKPFIDARYRTQPQRESTAIGGSSMGGLIALHACMTAPQMFAKCAALSPSLWWNDQAMTRRLLGDPMLLRSTRLWIDIGTEESAAPSDGSDRAAPIVRRFAGLLESRGVSRRNGLRFAEIRGAGHHERFWAERFDRVLMHLFGS